MCRFGSFLLPGFSTGFLASWPDFGVCVHFRFSFVISCPTEKQLEKDLYSRRFCGMLRLEDADVKEGKISILKFDKKRF